MKQALGKYLRPLMWLTALAVFLGGVPGLAAAKGKRADDPKRPAATPLRAKIAFASDRDGNFEIYTMDADGSNLARLTEDLGEDRNPAWSPDGTRLAFVSSRDGNAEIYV